MADIYNICFYGGLVLASLLLVVSIVLFIVLKIPSVIGELTGRTAKKSIEEMKASNKGSSAVSKKEQGKYYNQTTGKIKIRQAASAETIKKNNDDTTTILGDDAIPDTGKTEHVPDKATNDKEKITGDLRDEEATNVLSDEETTDVLRDEEVTDVLRDEEATDVLRGEEATDVLRDEEATDVLRDEEATDVLRDEEATDVLRGEEATDVLRIDDEDETSVLSSDDETSVLSFDGNATSVLTESMTSKLSSKVKVTYNVVVIHTDEQL